MTTAVQHLRVLPSSKEEVKIFSEKLLAELLNGEINPFELVRLKKSFESVFDIIKKELDALALEEAQKYGQKNFEAFGLKIQIGENGTRYDYDNCADPKYINLKTQADVISQRLKDRQDFLKTLKAPETLIDEETGDVVTVNPPIKSSTTGLKISLV